MPANNPLRLRAYKSLTVKRLYPSLQKVPNRSPIRHLLRYERAPFTLPFAVFCKTMLISTQKCLLLLNHIIDAHLYATVQLGVKSARTLVVHDTDRVGQRVQREAVAAYALERPAVT